MDGPRDRDGLEMLERSHRRLEERMDELQQAAEALASGHGGPDDVAAVDDVIAFLQRAALRHELDEEESLFPRLAGAGLDELLGTLVTEHDHHRAAVAGLGALRDAWPAAEPPTPADGAALAAAAADLARAYREHIDREDRDLLPAARARLSAAEKNALTGEMDARRGR